ncbi:hypothetical protein C922_04653 [Plasmodium inui San Antonio 1]|uniref:Uncharacterized protein n=1 Tax=Plasmodium inui San Antonio 1 TaxID=1237626 RepID=W7AI12_9APIC|nr:hypothetical protein C922_04653 [Plasmodium inui San Antonio 1]EUD64921.1 hypothetical protein C922_04653 [Plasmodium inui San Antonio 1]
MNPGKKHPPQGRYLTRTHHKEIELQGDRTGNIILREMPHTETSLYLRSRKDVAMEKCNTNEHYYSDMPDISIVKEIPHRGKASQLHDTRTTQ